MVLRATSVVGEEDDNEVTDLNPPTSAGGDAQKHAALKSD
jgi:hypothetical protein